MCDTITSILSNRWTRIASAVTLVATLSLIAAGPTAGQAPNHSPTHMGRRALPLAGGVMTGAIQWSHTYPPQITVVAGSTNGDLEITPGAGTDGTGRGSLIFTLGQPASGHSYQGGALVFKTTGVGILSEISAWGSGSPTVIYQRWAMITNTGLRLQTSGNGDIFMETGDAFVIENGGATRFHSNATGIGVFGATPIARPTAYTQTYATASRTHAALTSATLTNANGTGNTTIQDVTASHSQTILNDNFRDLSDQVNALRVDVENCKQVLNSVIDDQQSYGWLQ